MKNKIKNCALATVLAVSSISYADATLTKEQLDQQTKEMLAKAGIFIPNSHDVNIVSAKKYLDETLSYEDDFFKEYIRKSLLMNEEQNKNGYFMDDDVRSQELMNFRENAEIQKRKYRTSLSPESTHLRDSIGDLKMAYTFVGVPPKYVKNNFGVSPYGSYKQKSNGDLGDGWDGAVQFFENDTIGNCAFTEHNRILAKSGVELIKELVSYDVNGKPSLVVVKGSDATGFTYKVDWFDNVFSRSLECANSSYTKQLKQDVINLAKRIDKFQ